MKDSSHGLAVIACAVPINQVLHLDGGAPSMVEHLPWQERNDWVKDLTNHTQGMSDLFHI
jgi:hypothetical protein